MRFNFTLTSRYPLVLAFALMAFLPFGQLRAQYCLPAYGSQCTSGDYIDYFSFANIVNASTGCGSPSSNNYIDYSASLTANVVRGQTYLATCRPGPTWGQYYIAMIDFNQDSDFADPGEVFDIGYAAGGGTVSANITIPCGALTGITKLRVMCQYSNTQITQADICNQSLSFGEVEDYAINITQPTGTDGSISAISSPVTACGMDTSETVSVQVLNLGGSTINGFTVCYRINNGTPICETVSTSIPGCGSVLHTFMSNANLAIPGNYDFDAWVVVAGDATPSNDTLHNHIVTSIPVIGTLPYSENFETSDGGFTTGGTATSWEWGTPGGSFITNAASPTKCWATDLDSLFNEDETSYLLSPCYDFSSLTADPFLAFSHIFETDGFGDRDWIEVSTDAGTTWSKLGTFGTGNNWYNQQFNDWWSGTSGNAGQWQTADHRLTGTAGASSVRFRVIFESDAFTTLEGIGIDNIKILDTIVNLGVTDVFAPSNGCSLGNAEQVSVEVTNFGTHTLSNYSVCFTVDNGTPTCEIVAAPLAPGQSAVYNFTGTANLSTTGAHTFSAYTSVSTDSITDNDTLQVSVTNFPVVNTFPYVEDFEAGSGNWTSGGNSTDDWALGTPAKTTIIGAASGSNAWVTAGLGTNQYLNNADNWVESPCFDLSNLSNPWVGANVWWNSEFSWDGVVLEYSLDGGSNWSEIGNYLDPHNWYNDNSINGLQSAGGSGEGWSGRGVTNGSGGYVFAKHALDSLAGASNVRFRMHFGSDGSVIDDGFAFDDFVIENAPAVELGNDTVMCTSWLLDPNLPANGVFDWSTGDSTSTLTVTTAGTYVLTYTDSLGICEMDTIVISQTPTPVVDLGADLNVCMGSTECISVDSVSYPSILWSTSATTGQICVNSNGTWSVAVIDAFGCSSSDTVMTTLVPLPTPFLGADTVLCVGDSICLDPGCDPGNTYIWSNGATTAINCVNILSGYWVICTDSNGCQGADSILVNAGPGAPAAQYAVDTVNCPVIQFTDMTTGTATSFFWDFGDGNTSSSQNPSNDYTAAGNGVYSVTLIASNTCAADTVSLQVPINCLVSIGGALDNQLFIFPNPNTGKFMMQTQLVGTDEVQVEITDLNGKQVLVRNYGQMSGSFQEEIRLDENSKGIYFVKFQAGENSVIKKIVVQ